MSFLSVRNFQPVVLQVGQSNTAGSTNYQDGETYFNSREDARLLQWYRGSGAPSFTESSDGWEDLTVLTSPHSYDLAFQRHVRHSSNLSLPVVRFAASGQPLSGFFEVGADGWDYLLDALVDAQSDWGSQPIVVVGIIYVQGYNDSLDETKANAFLQKFTEWVAGVRALPSVKSDAPVMVVAHPPTWTTTEFGSVVRQAFTDYAASDPLCEIVSGEGTTSGDLVHYSYDSQDIIGDRLAKSFLGNFRH